MNAERFNNWTDLPNIKDHIRILEMRVDFMRELLAQAQKQEPVAWMYEVNNSHTCLDLFKPPDDAYDEGTLHPLYPSPTPRQWVGLTDEEIWKFWWSRPEVPDGEDDSMEAEFVAAVRRVLAAHGIKGEA